jgi:small-conductance mechanosensitive channel
MFATLATMIVETKGESLVTLSSVPPWWVLASITALAIAASWLLARVSRARAFATTRRWTPMLLVLIWLVVVAVWLRRLVPDEGAHGLARGAVLIVIAVAALPWLRNLFHAVVFGIENRYRLGDDLRVGAIEGRLSAIGSRAVVLRAANGTEITIPHATLATEHVVRLNLDVRDAPCELSLSAPGELDVQVATELARTAAALSPYAAPRSEPRVFVLTDELPTFVRLRLEGFVFDREHEPLYRSDVGARFLRMMRDHKQAQNMRELPEASLAGEEP